MATVIDTTLKADPTIILRDPQHASRLFVDDNFRLAPKQKFLFHVAFSINQEAVKNIDLIQRHRYEINMLVKSATLPSYTIKAEKLNQYNRKKLVQITHEHADVDITFHDDNMGVINQLWQNYYSYYYADPTSAKKAGAYNRNAMKNSNYITVPYGLDNGSTNSFFNYIKIYQMARHEYVCYTLHNPIITLWNHNKLDYAIQPSLHDNTMKVTYEAVSYSIGRVVKGDPEGFALEHYDQTPSPLTSNSTDQNGPSFVNNQINVSNNSSSTPVIIEQTNSPLISNTKSNTLSISSIIQGVSGIQGILFPIQKPSNQLTATPRKLIG